MSKNNQNNQKQPGHAIAEFKAPNFCAVRPIFMLSLGAQLLAFVLILATGDTLRHSWDELGLLSFFVQWIALASAMVLCLSRPLLDKLSFVWAIVAMYVLILLTSALIAYFAQIFIEAFDYQWGASPETMDDFVTRCVMITAVIALVILRYFYIQQQWKRRIELESQARVEALQARIRPHFLFNSMNIIASLIHSNPDAAEQAVEDLSELFRATLRDEGSLIAFSREWSLCQSYLNIEALRLGARLKLEVDFSQVPEDAAIPMLTLQPLFENAIYHGIQPIPKGGVIQIGSVRNDHMIEITIRNPIPPNALTRISKGNRIAMANIADRLNLLFGHQARLEIISDDRYYEVRVIFPYQRKGRINKLD